MSTTSPFDREISRYAGQLARAIYVGTPPPFSKESIQHNATMTLVKFPEVLVGVTCYHVFRKYVKLREQDLNPIFQIDRFPFDPIQHLIAQDEKRDLATFDLSAFAGEAGGLNRASIIEPHRWPPRPVSEGDIVCLAGYPGIWRDQMSTHELKLHSFSSGATFVDSATGERFTVGVHTGDPVVTFKKKELGFLGGLSGGPALCWRNDVILHAELVGFISDYHEEGDRMIVRAARVLNQDGTFQYLP
jgi:hypothetical protein